MPEENEHDLYRHDEERRDLDRDLLRLAKDAYASGEFLLSMFLYLAAFQKSQESSHGPDSDTLEGLKNAWRLACESKERSLAEYIFDLLEPYLSSDEASSYASRLQDLAFDRLEELGVSRNDIDDIAQLISDELVSVDGDGSIGGMFDGFLPMLSSSRESISAAPDGEDADESGKGPVESPAKDLLEGSLRDATSFCPEGFSYSDLSGYGKAIEIMHEFGIGNGSDPSFQKLVEMLNYRHGLKTSPGTDTIVLRSYAREDANRFAVATVGELGLPAVHMRMEEGFQGSPLLCISTYGTSNPNPMSLRESFADGGILVLESLDLWESPVMDLPEDGNPFLMMQLTRGAREAMALVRAAVDEPGILVIATASQEGRIDDFFLELLEPLALVDVSLPDESERMDIWMDISKNHPSFRQLNKKELVSYSAGMPRFDIYLAAREALEEAYKTGIAYKRYIPVSRENILDKLACYHSVDSEEYGILEDELVRDFGNGLDDLDDLLG